MDDLIDYLSPVKTSYSVNHSSETEKIYLDKQVFKKKKKKISKKERKIYSIYTACDTVYFI